MREQPFGPDPRYLDQADSSVYSAEPPRSRPVPRHCVKIDGDGTGHNAHSAAHTVHLRPDTPGEAGIDWEAHRSTAGWAALQWQGMLWTQLEVQPAPPPLRPGTLRISVQGAVEFALVPVVPRDVDGGDASACTENARDRASPAFEWHTADFYRYGTLNGVPHLLDVAPGKHWLVLKPLYEVRTSGGFPPDGVPALDVGVQIGLVPQGIPTLVLEKPWAHWPDVVAGRPAGRSVVLAVSNPNPNHPYTILSVDARRTASTADQPQWALQLEETRQRVPPLQTVRVYLGIAEPAVTIPSSVSRASYALQLSTAGEKPCLWCVDFDLDLVHVQAGSPYTYVHRSEAAHGPHPAIVVPPVKWQRKPDVAIVALHGAGVDIHSSPSWRRALPRQETAWIVMPSGLTPWGLDWQQSSLSSWREIVSDWEFTKPLMHVSSPNANSASSPPQSKSRGIEHTGPKLVIVGHSNGGQGAWHAMVHGGDDILAGVVAAGYIKLEEYVDFAWRDLRHTADPILAAILDSARSVFANDLHASNLAGLPLLIKYGARDDNVPPWQSRAMATLLGQWNALACVPKERWPRMKEVDGRGHWWDEILREDDIDGFLKAAVEGADRARPPPQKFVLTTVVPSMTEGRFGWRIVETDIPGRIARLEVEYVDAAASFRVRSNNVRQIELRGPTHVNAAARAGGCLLPVDIDGVTVSMQWTRKLITYARHDERGWQMHRGAPPPTPHPRLLCPISLLLDRGPPILIVQPTRTSKERRHKYASVSRRWAQSLLLYTGIRAVLVVPEGSGDCRPYMQHTCVFMGGTDENAHLQLFQRSLSKPVDFIKHLGAGQFTVRDRTFAAPGTALLYAMPHLSARSRDTGIQARSRAYVVAGTDLDGIERAGRLLPVRTGTGVPEWIVVGAQADRFGGGGVLAAGWYDRSWGFSPAMSYLG
ncbi:unnamed protein product [Parajaminaea phylloscopi]